MSPNVAGAIYAVFGVVIAGLLLPPRSDWPVAWRAYAVWLVTIPVVFFVRDQMQVMLLAFAIFTVLAFHADAGRAAFFVAAVPTIPTLYSDFIPFPGINYLTTATPYKVAVLAILLPVLFMAELRRKPASVWRAPDIAIIASVVYVALMETVDGSVTVGLRALVDELLLLVIPYLALVRCLGTPNAVTSVARSVVLVSAILAGIELVAVVKQWDFYVYVRPANVFTIPDTRAGFVRMELTANTHSLGFQMVLGLLCLELVNSRIALSRLTLMGLRLLFLVGLYFTDSRGAMLAFVGGGVVYVALFTESFVWRWALVVSSAVGLAAVGVWLALFAPEEFDPYGGVSYRQELLRAGLSHIAKHPLFGNLDFLHSSDFSHLTQGQGIIDITNLYLQIALPYGLIGLSLFLTVQLGSLAKLLWSRLSETGGAGLIRRRWRALAAAAVIAWLILVATTSSIGLTVHLGIVVAALARALADPDFAFDGEPAVARSKEREGRRWSQQLSPVPSATRRNVVAAHKIWLREPG
jgi:hypothetical protein